MSYRNENEANLYDFCCHGDCRQGRECPRDPPLFASSPVASFAVALVLAIGAAVVGLILGGWIQ